MWVGTLGWKWKRRWDLKWRQRNHLVSCENPLLTPYRFFPETAFFESLASLEHFFHHSSSFSFYTIFTSNLTRDFLKKRWYPNPTPKTEVFFPQQKHDKEAWVSIICLQLRLKPTNIESVIEKKNTPFQILLLECQTSLQNLTSIINFGPAGQFSPSALSLGAISNINRIKSRTEADVLSRHFSWGTSIHTLRPERAGPLNKVWDIDFL